MITCTKSFVGSVLFRRVPSLTAAFLVLATAGSPAASPDEAPPVSPWGITAHALRTNESQNREVLIRRMKEAGITTLREEFSYTRVHNAKGEFDFTRFDELLSKLDASGIGVVGILSAYNNDLSKGGHGRFVPMYAHPEEWRKYVREVVRRYHDRVEAWVVWNEPDGGFWAPRPNAAEYVPLLKIAYEEIKAANPKALVVTGGLESWNTEYLSDMYIAGARGYFDVVGVHRYGPGPDANPYVQRTMREFRDVMARNDQAEVPVWILEAGGSTFLTPLVEQQPLFMDKAIRFALSSINRPVPEGSPIVAGIPLSPRQVHPNEIENTRAWLPGVTLQVIPFEQLATLDPAKCPVLVIDRGLHIDDPMLEPLRAWVERGGLIVASGHPPFYVRHWKDANGVWQRKDDAGVTYPLFRMGFAAYWNTKGIPVNTRNVAVAPEAAAAGIPAVKDIYVNNFFTSKNLKPGDKYQPILSAIDAQGKPVADAIALYTYDDWKGGILASTPKLGGGWTEEEQAVFLPRIYLSYLASGSGVERIFIYDLHDDGQQRGEPEHNFGLTHWDWSPKPALGAYREMTQALGAAPEFVRRIESANPAIWALLFRRTDNGQQVVAAWSTKEGVSFAITGAGAEEKGWPVNSTAVRYLPLANDTDAARLAVREAEVEVKP